MEEYTTTFRCNDDDCRPILFKISSVFVAALAIFLLLLLLLLSLLIIIMIIIAVVTIGLIYSSVMVEYMASMDVLVDRLKNGGEGDVQFGFYMLNNGN